MLKSQHEQRAKRIEEFIKTIANKSFCASTSHAAEESSGPVLETTLPKPCPPVKSPEAVPTRPKINQKLIRTKADISFITSMYLVGFNYLWANKTRNGTTE